MQYEVFEVGSFAVNCSIVSYAGKTFIVDPGQEASRIMSGLSAKKSEPDAILLTHAHFDHIGAIGELQAKYPGLKVYVHSKDAEIIAHPMNQYPPDYPPVKFPHDIAELSELAGLGIRVLETPGHTPGGVCYYFADDGVLFSGDTLFAGSVGRTDLPGGNSSVLMESLKQLKELPSETKVIPGHGMFTTIGRELKTNPYLQ